MMDSIELTSSITGTYALGAEGTVTVTSSKGTTSRKLDATMMRRANHALALLEHLHEINKHGVYTYFVTIPLWVSTDGNTATCTVSTITD